MFNLQRILLLFILCVSLSEAQDEFSLAAGFDFTTGDYGQAVDTSILYLPVTARYKADAYTLWLTVPYIIINGPGNVVPKIGPIQKGTAAAATTNHGLGDLVAGFSHNIYENRKQGSFIDLAYKIKFGTANENKGLGTGENDYSVQADIYQTLQSYTLFGTLGFTLVGDQPGNNLDNRSFYSVGFAHKLSASSEAGLIYDASGKAFDFDADREEVTGYYSHKISALRKIQYYGMLGLGRDSPDVGFGLVVTHVFR